MLDLTDRYIFKDYKGFCLKFMEDNSSMGDIRCLVHKPGYIEKQRNEHGQLQLITHKSEEFSFTVEYREFLIEDCPSEMVIYNRFLTEVDYYLKQKENVEEPVNSLIRKYICPCCGTAYTTDKFGYTPKCINCGAPMNEEASA